MTVTKHLNEVPLLLLKDRSLSFSYDWRISNTDSVCLIHKEVYKLRMNLSTEGQFCFCLIKLKITLSNLKGPNFALFVIVSIK